MTSHPEQQAAARREGTEATACFPHSQTEESGEGIWDTMQGNRGPWRFGCPCIASQSDLPVEARMGTLSSCKDTRRTCRLTRSRVRQADVSALVAHEVHASSSMLAARPISPQQWSETSLERMQQAAHLARLCRLMPMPLALFPQGTGTTIGDPGREDHAQAATLFAAPFTRKEHLARRTPYGPLWLEGESLSCKATRLPRSPNHRRAVARYGRRLGASYSKLRRAHSSRGELMTQFQTQVPQSLADDLPGLLSSQRVATPAVGVKLSVFIGKCRLKGATTQLQGDDISRRKGALRQGGKEQFVDEARAFEANAVLCLACWMSRHHNPTALPLRSH